MTRMYIQHTNILRENLSRAEFCILSKQLRKSIKAFKNKIKLRMDEYDEMYGIEDDFEQQFADELEVMAEMDRE